MLVFWFGNPARVESSPVGVESRRGLTALPSSPATLVMKTAKVDEGDKKPAAVSMLKHNPVNNKTVVAALPSAPATSMVKTAEEDEGDKKPAAVSMLKHNPTNNQTILRTPGIQMVEALADNVCWASPDTLNKPPAMIVAGDETNTRKKRCYTRSFSDFETAQGHKIKDMPGHMQPVATNRQSMLEAKAAAFDRIIGIAHNKKKFVWNDQSQAYIAAGMIQIPAAANFAWERAFPCVIAAFLVAAGVAVDPAAVASTCPSAHSLQDILISGAVSALIFIQAKLGRSKAVFLACDKGRRKGVDHFAKVLSWWDNLECRVCSYTIDIDGAGSSSKEAADAINNSIEKVRPVFDSIKFFGQTTDSGGGGVLESLHRFLAALGLCTSKWAYEYYAVAGCGLHGLQLGFANGMKAAFGEGGLRIRTLLQLLHSCYDLQKHMPGAECKLLWTLITECPPPDTKITAAVLTRWWYVNQACKHLDLHWEEWRALAQGLLASTNSMTAVAHASRPPPEDPCHERE